MNTYKHTCTPLTNQMPENIKTLFIPGYASLKTFVFQKLRIDVSSTVEKQATSQIKLAGQLLIFH